MPFADTPLMFAALIVLGLAVGILSGLLGVGGGVLLTPALHVLGFSMPTAIATSLTQMVGSSLSGSIRHAKQGTVAWRLALLMGVPGICGVALGKKLAIGARQHHVGELALALLNLAMIAFIIWSIIRKGRRTPRVPSKVPKIWSLGPKRAIGFGTTQVALVPCALLGVFVGFLSSVTGLGGGFPYIPSLMLLAGASMKEAVGTSLATVFLSSLYGASVYTIAGVSDLKVAGLLMLGSIVGAQVGAYAASKSDTRGLETSFVYLLSAAFLSLCLQILRYDILAEIVIFGGGALIVTRTMYKVFLKSRKPPSVYS